MYIYIVSMPDAAFTLQMLPVAWPTTIRTTVHVSAK